MPGPMHTRHLYCKKSKKDPNFEFLSSWNESEYEDIPEAPVTEMTDEKFQELGFPVDRDQDSSHVSDLVRPPSDSVINNPFITFVSRKYPLVGDPLVSLNHKIM